MIRADAVAVVLLAAGLSTRFGARDKLAEPLDGLPLGLHAATMLARFPFATRLVVAGAQGPDFTGLGFRTIVNPSPGDGLSGSIRLGMAEAPAAEALLIALADMPFVTGGHISALLQRLDAAHPVVGSSDGRHPCPPALFAASRFDLLEQVSGDAGARTLLRDAVLVAATPAEMADIDTPADLAARGG